MLYSVTQYHTPLIRKKRDDHSLSTSLDGEGKQLCADVCSTVVGLLALYLFLLMGGIFAFLGPWVILAGTHSVMKRSRVLGSITGGTFLCLGVMAFLLPNHAGNWGAIGGLLALCCGLRYLGMVVNVKIQRQTFGDSVVSATGNA